MRAFDLGAPRACLQLQKPSCYTGTGKRGIIPALVRNPFIFGLTITLLRQAILPLAELS
jgi:hypothetical protein